MCEVCLQNVWRLLQCAGNAYIKTLSGNSVIIKLQIQMIASETTDGRITSLPPGSS